MFKKTAMSILYVFTLKEIQFTTDKWTKPGYTLPGLCD
jgi:hypothetical protein